MIRAIIFDLWNTLAVKPSVSEALRQQFGFSFAQQTYEQAIQTQFWDSPEDLALVLLREFELARSESNVRFVVQQLMHSSSNAMSIFGAKQLLAQLNMEKMAILSNTTNFEILNPAWTLNQHFESIVYSYEIGACKPATESFDVVCKKLKVRPNECLFIDDSLQNVQAARAFGMQAVQFLSMPQLVRELRPWLSAAHRFSPLP